MRPKLVAIRFYVRIQTIYVFSLTSIGFKDGKIMFKDATISLIFVLPVATLTKTGRVVCGTEFAFRIARFLSIFHIFDVFKTH